MGTVLLIKSDRSLEPIDFSSRQVTQQMVILQLFIVHCSKDKKMNWKVKMELFFLSKCEYFLLCYLQSNNVVVASAIVLN